MTQIGDYTERVKRMVGKVLTGNGITRYERGTYVLVGGEELNDAEREELLELCRQRLDAFREQRGEEVGCFVCSSRSLRIRPPQPPPHADQRLVKHRVLNRAHAAPGCCQTTQLV